MVVSLANCLCFSGIKTTETHHGHRKPTQFLNSTGPSWQQSWPLLYSFRYDIYNGGFGFAKHLWDPGVSFV